MIPPTSLASILPRKRKPPSAAAIESGSAPEQALNDVFAATSAADDWFNEEARRAIQKKHDDYKHWITETMETEDKPSIRFFAVFGNFEG